MKPVPHLVLMPPNWIGDAIMAQPAMRAIATHARKHWQCERVSVVGRGWLADLLPWLNIEGATVADSLPAADMAVLFPNSFRAAWLCRKAGIREIVGYRSQWRRLLLTQALPQRLDMRHQHHREYFLDIARQMMIEPEQSDVHLLAPEGAQATGAALLEKHGLDPERVICLAPGAQFGGAKCYPSEKFAEITYHLAEAGYQPVVLGLAEDRDVGAFILTDLRQHHWNAAGETSMREALEIIAASRLMLCNDSGLMHVAAGLGKPTVAPFGATDPARTAPSGDLARVIYRPASCSPCLQRECNVAGHPCMANISAQLLLETCLSLLEPANSTNNR